MLYEIIADSQPLASFLAFAKAINLVIDLSDDVSELFCVESKHGATDASQLIVRLYPSDRLLALMAAHIALDKRNFYMVA